MVQVSFIKLDNAAVGLWDRLYSIKSTNLSAGSQSRSVLNCKI